MKEIVVPFLKWAGGKRWLASSHRELFSECSGRHIEPFAGSAAVFFATQPDKAILADMNSRLIEAYIAIRDTPVEFESYFHEFARKHSKDHYYAVRSKKFRVEAKRAAQFVYLNRVCFNGIYRENLRGEFNVPIGSKQTAVLDTDDFAKISRCLRNAELRCSDFEPIIDDAVRGDFVYVDPPYTTKHNLNGFVKYNQKIFSWEDQVRLSKVLKSAAKRGVTILVSNADHAEVRDLYRDFLEIKSVERSNVIASRSCHRGKTTEMVAGNDL
jgi:DNA adenine methylase